MTAGPAPLLSVRDLSVSFRVGAHDVPAITGVSIDVLAGETVAVVGESGSGKSTTAAAINRLLAENARIVSGEIRLEGRDLAELTERQMHAIRGAQIGLVPQDPMSNLNPLMRIGAQIAEALEVHGVAAGKAVRAKVLELLDMVGIPEPARRMNQFPHEFSGGMRQRVLIAMGLACRPRLLIADEPTSALDVTVQRQVLDQLGQLTAELGTAVFLITHDLALAAERADRIVVMSRGQVVETGAADAILHDPQHEYTKRLLGAAPSLSSGRLIRVSSRLGSDAPPARAADDIVEARHLTKEFSLRQTLGRGASNFTAVDDVSFTIPRGRTVSLVGESGSGKSTTANLVLALEKPTAGSIRFNGADLADFGKRELFAFRRHVQPVFQNPFASLDPRYTVEESILEPLQVHRIGEAGSRRRTLAAVLDKVALPSTMLSRLPHELSGGQRQRVAIARAIALSPELVVLDEAVSALDVLVQEQILELLVELQYELGLSYLFISHDLAVVRMVSHEVHVMRRGKVVESGPPEQIFDAPQHEYTRELLRAIPAPRVEA